MPDSKTTVDRGDRQLRRRLKIAAVEHDMSVRDFVIEAVRYWPDHQEEIEGELAADTADRIAAESSGEYATHYEVKKRFRR
jgi:hypothetical protein